MQNYADVLESYMIPATELYASPIQKYDEKFIRSKISLDDFEVIIIDENNFSQMMSKYKKLDLPWFNKKRSLKDGVIWVRVITKDTHKVVATADIWSAKLAIEQRVAMYDNVPYDETKTYLNDITVRKDFHGRGIGKQLLKYLISKFNIGYVESYKEGEVATRLYQSLGFKVYYTDEDIYFMKR